MSSNFYNTLFSDDSDKRFYGVYRGIIVDSKDPSKKGRLKVKVPQVTGDAVTNWAWPITGGVQNFEMPYGLFTHNSTVTATSTTVAYVANYDTTEDSGGGIYVSATNPSRIYVSKSGDYQILFSPQFSSSTSSNVQADVWLRVNGVDVPRSNSRITLQGNPNEILNTVPFIADLEAGDYIEVAWRAGSTNISIKAFSGLTNPTRPNIPSIITSVYMIGNYTPAPGTGAWIMYEGGDPNFPLWMGVF